MTSFQTGSLTSLLSDELNVTIDEFAATEPEPEPVDPTGGVRATNETGNKFKIVNCQFDCQFKLPISKKMSYNTEG